MEADENAVLVQACRRGDSNAWEALIRRYQRLIYTIARRMGLDEENAAEVFQQVCITLFRHLNHIEQPERLAAWLTTITRRESLRQQQHERVTLPLFEGWGDDNAHSAPLDPAPLPEEAFERLERQHLVRRALATLDERSRRLLTLLFYSAEPPAYAELAAQLELSAGSIGPTRARCLKKLRLALEQLDF